MKYKRKNKRTEKKKRKKWVGDVKMVLMLTMRWTYDQNKDMSSFDV